MKQLFALKVCKCGVFHEFLPQVYNSDHHMELVFFECFKCKRTVTIPEKFVVDQLLNNAWVTKIASGAYDKKKVA